MFKEMSDCYYRGILVRVMQIQDGKVKLRPHSAMVDLGEGLGMDVTVSKDDFENNVEALI